MNAPQAVPQVGAAPSSLSLKVGQCVVQGRVFAIRKAGKLFEHLIVMPAPDPYSSPATLSVMSERRLGEKDEDVRVVVRLGGYRRSYKTTDQETGEQRTVQTADVKLFALE